MVGNAPMYSTKTRNACTTGNSKNMGTSVERLFHKTADVKVFKRFGYTSLIYVPLELRIKLDVAVEGLWY